ncbi:MAG: Ribonuclease 1 [Rickettsiaceae bacterium]|jgi:ribonuclease J|nr:Ribonuclease 1 [Rickettsiaceae bacterium]
MQLNLKKHREDLLFIPLGGASEIGMNVNLYHLDGKWIMVDCGLGFAHDIPGIDMITADISFIKAHKKDLLGIIITHIHEDHLGAVQHLWQELEAPVYTSDFAAKFLRAKLEEYPFANRVKINVIDEEKELKIGSFNIEFIGLTHSVPEMNALLIKTKHGNILHSGDWKFDPNPVVGKLSEKEKIKAYGDRGEILALVCDSTNALSPGHSRSEGELFESLKSIIQDCKQLVGVTTFASNIARVFTIVKVAEACGRKVCLAGFSLQRLKEIAIKTGYFKDLPAFISDKEIKFFSPSEVLVLSTGCQGEGNAGTMKIAKDIHPTIKFKAGDTMIFSSKIIPGNEKSIFALFNLFARKKVEVITEKDHFVHVSGHPNQDELREMYELARPQIAIPVHGEFVHLKQHAILVKEWGVKNSITVENGTAVKLSRENSEIVGHVQSGYFGVDGRQLLPLQGEVIKARYALQSAGVVIVVVVVDGNSGNVIGDVEIKAPGAVDFSKDQESLCWIKQDVIVAVKSSSKELFRNKKSFAGKLFGKKGNSNNQQNNKAVEVITKAIRTKVGKNFGDLMGKKPFMEVFVRII